MANNNIAIASSNEKADIRFSMSHNYQKGIVPNTQLNIVNFSVNAGINFSKKLRLETNLNCNRQFTPNIPDVNYSPNSLIYKMTIWGGADWNVDDMRNYWQAGKEGVQQIYAEYQRYNNPYFSPLVNGLGTQVGFANPDFIWGLNNRVSYKNWALSFQFDGRVGGVIEDYIRR